MLPGATDAGLFFKPAQMLSIGKSTKNPQAAAKVINFLLNSKEGVDILGLERGVPLSKAAVTYLTEDGVIKADDPAVSGLKLAQSLPTALPVSPYFDDPQIVAQFGTTLQYIDYGKSRWKKRPRTSSARPTAFCAARCANLPVGNLPRRTPRESLPEHPVRRNI